MNSYENLYHCNHCRMVRCLEETADKLQTHCPVCDSIWTHYRVDVDSGMTIEDIHSSMPRT